ncbi:transporter substrate-binding domain-containing protein [Streptococcus caprae]|uniref:Transporter substrate-binding domain-containing protein n=1 Tax=Streptococcus caprae TaxID=1640501 RepID=A0ABV8CVR4_9STRE
MKLKNILKVGAVALASTLVLAACGSKSSSTDTADTKAAEKETVVLATVGTTKPFSYEADGNLTGYDIEVARAVFEGSEKYELKIEKTAWSSIFAGLDSDKFAIGANNISYNEERAAKYLYSLPTASNPLVLAVNKNSGIKSYDDIAGKSTQVVQGTSTAAMLETYNTEHADAQTNINYTNEDLAQMLLSLDSGKFDYKIFETQSVRTIVEEQGLENIEIIELDLESDQKPYVYFVLSQSQEDVQKFINERLKELYKDGTLEKLSQEFLGGSYLPDASEFE